MILSIDAEKAFDKIQHPFLIKTLKKVHPYYSFIPEGFEPSQKPLRIGQPCPSSPALCSTAIRSHERGRGKKQPRDRVGSPAGETPGCEVTTEGSLDRAWGRSGRASWRRRQLRGFSERRTRSRHEGKLRDSREKTEARRQRGLAYLGTQTAPGPELRGRGGDAG